MILLLPQKKENPRGRVQKGDKNPVSLKNGPLDELNHDEIQPQISKQTNESSTNTTTGTSSSEFEMIEHKDIQTPQSNDNLLTTTNNIEQETSPKINKNGRDMRIFFGGNRHNLRLRNFRKT